MREGGSVPIVLPSKANFDSMSFLPLFLFVAALQPVAAGWADILRTTTATTQNPDKPGILRLLVIEDWKQKENMIFYEVFFGQATNILMNPSGAQVFFANEDLGDPPEKKVKAIENFVCHY